MIRAPTTTPINIYQYLSTRQREQIVNNFDLYSYLPQIFKSTKTIY
jgi:hypothetical protein